MHPTSPAVLACVVVGGAAGALSRYAVGELLGPAAGGFAWATFVVNVLGCALVGLLAALVLERPGPSPLLRPLLITGFLGGFTTFSAYALDVRAASVDGSFPVAIGYLCGTLAATFVAVLAGRRAGRALVGASRA